MYCEKPIEPAQVLMTTESMRVEFTEVCLHAVHHQCLVDSLRPDQRDPKNEFMGIGYKDGERNKVEIPCLVV